MRAVPALFVLAAVLAGCGDDDEVDGATDASEAPADADEAGDSLEVTAADFSFAGLPDEMAGGAVTVTMTNEGETAHEIAFVNIGDEANAPQFFDDFGPVIEGGAPWPEYVGNVAGANEAEPGASMTATYQLAPGTYMVFCALTGTAEDPESEDSPPHFVQGMQQLVTVTEPVGSAELPEADGTITARDYEFEADLSAGDQVIDFVNEGPNDHFAAISKFPEGTTAEDAEAAMDEMMASEDGSVPEGTPEPEEIGFSGIASADTAMQFELLEPLEAGVYSFVCFLSDRTGGPPHAIGNHMVTVVEIS